MLARCPDHFAIFAKLAKLAISTSPIPDILRGFSITCEWSHNCHLSRRFEGGLQAKCAVFA
jgi:hypothetical protein